MKKPPTKKPIKKAPRALKPSQTRTVIFDTETTGLISNRTVKIDKLPEVIEFYAVEVDLDTGELGREVDLLIRPRNKIPEKIEGLTGIKNEMVKSAPTFSEAAARIVDILSKADCVIAHNARFDVDMVEVELERLSIPITWPAVLCTIEQSMHYRCNRMNQGDLYEFLLGRRFQNAHRAKNDVMALVEICIEMRKRGDL